ncbi:peptidase S8/S53 domain-containing protein [Mucor mucedo]|uniref:peptidase S8/S53 domain-containing protein n=1 Tax=Mucor mucedo TaxID=29922 RepID=UPI002220A773|nr:peptidase S8/S53 domain-containing protein [Mucor mucedo]KAI7890621.1 peptidase S8/S53 domain-containing protein [Mucor mucedo]
MKKPSFSYFPIVVAGVCLAVFVMTADAINIIHPKYNKGSSDIIPGRYIVSFTSKSKSAGSIFTQSLQEGIESDLKVNQRYSHELFNGLSIKLDTTDDAIHTSSLQTILDRSDVKSVTPVRLINRPEIIVEKIKKGKKASTPSVLPHAMTQVDRVHSELKNKGKGVLVAVLDTGIDYLHPALGGGFGKGFKVSNGYDLVGDAYTGSNNPVPDSDPLDKCGVASGASGHGTHVSGIIAGYEASTNFTGVAPEANLAMFRVFGCTGQVSNDVVIKALLMAYDAGADVVNLSLGATNAWGTTSDTESDIVNKLVEKGVSVVISAGNSGAQGIYTVGQPGTSKNAFTVASVENQYYTAKELTASGIDHGILYSPSGVDTIVDNDVAISDKTPGTAADSCTAAQISPDVKGKIALIQRGSCNFSDKVNNAASAGAVGAIIYNNVDGSLSASVPGVTIPVVSITNADGKELVAAILKGSVKITFNHAGAIHPVTDGGSISSFSSNGAESELNFKPNIAGIGGNVYSTLPRYLDSWGIMSGTSMAAPYVAGSVALYVHSEGSKKRQSISFVNEQFQNYALPTKVYNTSTIDSPIRQGAGLVQVYDAITQKTHVTPAQITFKDSSDSKSKTQSITITNRGSKTISYEVKNDISTAISPYDVKASGYAPLEPADNYSAAAKLRFSTKAFKLAPGKSKKITFTVTPPKTNPKDHIFYGGFIHVVSKQKSNGKDIKVPYFGVVGSQKTLPVFDTGFPTIIDRQSNEYGPKDTFTFDRAVKNSSPIAVIRLLTPSKTIKAELLDAKTKKVVGLFLTGLDYNGRNFLTGDTRYDQYSWDGTYIPASIPDAPFPIPAPAGTYLWRLSALKLLGNPKTKKDWETYTSGPIVLKN